MKKKEKSKIDWKWIFLQFSLFFNILVVIEIVLRFQGYLPGQAKSADFSPVEELEEMDIFYGDEVGASHLNPYSKYWPEGKIINKEGFPSPYQFYSTTIDSLKEHAPPITMLVGDSYAEGCCASSDQKSFAGLLHNNPNYTLLNLGVGGTDPLQYKLIVQKYSPRLFPELIVVTVFLGNDDMKYDRTPKHYLPIYFPIKNCGWLPSEHPENIYNCQNDYFVCGENAYNYFLKKYTLLGGHRSEFTKIMRNSVLYSQLVLSLSNKGKILCTGASSPPFSYQNLKELSDYCLSRKIPLLLVGIPSVFDARDQSNVADKYEFLFNELEWVYPDISEYSVEDYDHVSTLSHYNDQGHAKFAAFLNQEILKKMKAIQSY